MTEGEKQSPSAKRKGGSTASAKWYDGWVDKLVDGDGRLTRTVLLSGYLGKSTGEGMLRVYLDQHLHSAVDIALEGVVHREAIPPTLSPLGGSYLWVTLDCWNRRMPLLRARDENDSSCEAE